jgi:O-antigen/teichoic acid export membrane protein
MKLLKDFFGDHLYKSSMWLIADSVVATGLGFFFWAINTRLFSPEEVGIASTLLAAAGLRVVLSQLGFDVAFMRYLPGLKKKNNMINSCFSVGAIAAFILGLAFVLNVNEILPELGLLKENILYGAFFVVFVVFDLLSVLLGSVFIALRGSRLVFYRDVTFGILKLLFPFLFVTLGAYGIFSSWMVAVIASFVLILLYSGYKIRFEIHKRVIKNIFRFTTVNYASNFLSIAPGLVLPLMITHLINPTTTAYFYIDWMIASMLFVIPIAVSKSLLTEGSRGQKNLKKKVNKALGFTYVLLFFAVLFTFTLSKPLLMLFGGEYSANAFGLLRVLALSSLPLAVNVIYISVQNVRHNIKAVIATNFVITFGTLGLSYAFIHHGILMVGISWLIIHAIVACYTTTRLVTDG